MRLRLLLLLFCLVSTRCFGAQFEVLLTSGQSQIQGLDMDLSGALPVEIDQSTQEPRGYVVLRGHFKRESGALLIDGQRADLSKDGEFSQKVYLSDSVQTVLIRDVSIYGKVLSNELTLRFPAIGAFKLYLADVATDRKDFVRVSGGYSHISYNQVGLANLSEDNLLIQGFYTRVLNQSLSVNVSSFGSFPLSSNQPSVHLDLFAVDGQVGFSPHWPSEPWKLTLFAGVYYLKTFSADFGYDFLGPQLYPYLQRTFSSGSSANVYFKYSPLRGSGDFTFSNREIACGLGYSYRLGSGHPLSLNFDYSQLDFASNGLSITQSSEGISAGYGF